MRVTSSARRPTGRPPFWHPGTQVVWREGSGPLGTGDPVDDPTEPHFATPVTVVRDDTDGLVVWLSVGTPVVRLVRADGLDKRAEPSTLFTAPVVASHGLHALYDQVRVVPTGRAWSAWAMFSADSGTFCGWYVNFERPHLRDVYSTYTSDHVLDLWVEPDRTVFRKDEDELALAVEQGALDAATADAAMDHCRDVEAIVAAWRPPFCEGWERFQPDPSWRTPG